MDYENETRNLQYLNKNKSDGCLREAKDYTTSLSKGVRKGEGVGVKLPPLSLIFHKISITSAKEIKCFRIPFAC